MYQEYVSTLKTSLRYGDRLQFDAEHHEFSIGGLTLPSVTTMLKEVGIIDDSFYRSEATERGTRVHRVTELIDKGTLDWGSVHSPDLVYLEGWVAFTMAHRPTFLALEVIGCDPVARFAGIVDRLAIMDGYPTLLDIKTGTPARWHALQMGLYKQMVERAVRSVGRPPWVSDDDGDWQTVRTALVYLGQRHPDGYRMVPVDPPADVCAAIPAVVNWMRAA